MSQATNFFNALRSSDGSVWNWGLGTSGQIGDRSNFSKSSPVSVVGNHSFVFVANTTTTGAGIKSDGSVWAWGAGNVGQLGHNSNAARSSPVSVVGNHSFISVAGGGLNFFALKADGGAWFWGADDRGQGGRNTTFANISSPVSIVGGHSFVYLEGGATMGTALKADGSAWNWGQGTSGALGQGTVSVGRSSPVSVVGGHSFIKIKSGGQDQSMALKADGTVWTWGIASSGQLGNNLNTARSSPVSVVGNHSFINISAGNNFNLALKADGGAWGWGLATSGQLGEIQVLSNRSSPVSVVGGHSFVRLVAGAVNSYGLKADGSIWAWGDKSFGGLGNGTDSYQKSPISVVGGHSFTSVKAGLVFAVSLKSDGSAWSWGLNNNGMLGDTTSIAKSSPVSVVGGHSFAVLSNTIGQFNAGALKADGSAWIWGVGSSGELGNNTASSPGSPTSVVGSHSFTVLSVGASGSRALKADGSVWSWGSATSGRLGNNDSTVNRSSPVSVVGGHSFIKISSYGAGSVFALKADGSAWAWGLGTTGEMGDNNNASRSSPVSVIGAHSFVDIVGSQGLKADGSVWTWGAGTVGELGNNGATSRSSPVSVVGGHSFTAITITKGLKADGSVWSWGSNSTSGGVGDGTVFNRSSPVSVVGGHSFISISFYGGTTGLNTHALKADGSVWSWGLDNWGVMGNNGDQRVASPVQVLSPVSGIKKINNVLVNKAPFNDITTGSATLNIVKKLNNVDYGGVNKISNNQ
jgi:alpha-tubulin suppressor-like RCC1 family protein